MQQCAALNKSDLSQQSEQKRFHKLLLTVVIFGAVVMEDTVHVSISNSAFFQKKKGNKTEMHPCRQSPIYSYEVARWSIEP